jgi:hypothetical protein
MVMQSRTDGRTPHLSSLLMLAIVLSAAVPVLLA